MADFVEIAGKLKDWSRKKFGSGTQTKHLVEHVKEELDEVIEDFEKGNFPEISEWIDVLILTLDALLREGNSPQHILQLLSKKIDINANRKWSA